MSIADLRQSLEDNRRVVMVVAGVLICLSLIWLVLRLLGGGGSASLSTQATVIYYDLDAKVVRLVEHDLANGLAPSPMPGEENVLVASVWYCDGGKDVSVSDGMSLEAMQEQGLFIAWLEKNDPDAEVNDYAPDPVLYRTLEKPTWHKADTPGSFAILESPLDRCDNPAQYVAK